MSTQEALFDDGAIWAAASQQGITLVPFSSNGSGTVLSAAIAEDLLRETMTKLGFNPDSWDDVFGLGLGFFVDMSAPGSGTNRAESYRDALATYEATDMKARNAKQLAVLRAQKP